MSVTSSHIRIWRNVRESTARVDDLVAELSELAAMSLSDRASLLSLVGSLLDHESPEVRGAAVRCLADASGPLAWQWIVKRLNDPAETVRQAAVDSLVRSATYDPDRMVHAVFHSDLSVRRAVVEHRDRIPDESRWCTFLIADPACRDAACTRLVNGEICDDSVGFIIQQHETGRLSDEAFTMLMANYYQKTCGVHDGLVTCLQIAWLRSLLTHQDLLDAEWIGRRRLGAGPFRHDAAAVWLYQLLQTRRADQVVIDDLLMQVVLTLGPATLSGLLRESRSQTNRNVEHILVTARSVKGLQNLQRGPAEDILDHVLDLVWPPADASSPRDRDRVETESAFVFEAIELSTDDGRRLAAAILWAAQRHGWWHRPATLAAARHYPEMLAIPSLPVDLREFLFRRLAEGVGIRPKFTRTRLTDLLVRVVSPGPGCQIDLLATAAVLSFFPGGGFEKATSKLKLDRLVAAVEYDLERAVPLFCLNDDDKARDRILEHLRKTGGDAAPTTSGPFSPVASELFSPTSFEQLVARMSLRLEPVRLKVAIRQDAMTVVQIVSELLSLLGSERRVASFVVEHGRLLGREVGRKADVPFLERCLLMLPLAVVPDVEAVENAFLNGILQSAPARSLVAALGKCPDERRETLIDRLFASPTAERSKDARNFSWANLSTEIKTQLLSELSRQRQPARQKSSADRLEARPNSEADSLPGPSESDAESATGLQEAIAASHDIDWLAGRCCDSNLDVAENAAFRLLDIASEGPSALAHLLLRSSPVPHSEALAWTVPLWPRELVDHLAAQFMNDDRLDLRLRFIIGLGLTEFGLQGIYEKLLQLVCQPAEAEWFTEDLWKRLKQVAPSEEDLAFALIRSDQTVAIERSAGLLCLPHGDDQSRALAAVAEAVERCPQKMPVWSADRLASHGVDAARLLLVDAVLVGNWVRIIGDPTSDELVGHMVTDTVLGAGNSTHQEQVVLDYLAKVESDSWVADVLQRLLLDGTDDEVRRKAADQLQVLNEQGASIGRITSVFAWGSQTARRLTGQRIRIRMLSNDELGLMRHGVPEIFVSPLPILERARHADDVVKGLIVHELGHHMYHSADDFNDCHARARKENLASLWNIVLDEHLERNLRAIDREYGDQLKKLNAYAFQHKPKEFTVGQLLSMLGPFAFDALTRCNLLPARTQGSVFIPPGVVLQELETHGSSFARFFRALLMGLGNRSDDPKVAEGLALFQNNFRQSSAEELFEITLRLREIFGNETNMLDQFGTDSLIPRAESALSSSAAGLSDEKLDAAIRRFVEGFPDETPPPPDASPRAARNSGNMQRVFNLNVTPNEQFEEITDVVALRYDADAHRQLSAEVAPQMRRLRQFLCDLGFGYDTNRMRTSGRRLDRTRLIPLIVRQDPRVMISRQVSFDNDLFLSVVVDCSYSMSGGDIEKARSFATLVADACHGLPGVDVRLFGFTSDQIFDAGDARKCAAHALEPSGGNNDAAGLAHAADAAFRSNRRAKALIMISDGLPTDCSVDALRGLVRRLTYRYGIVCAQVATQELGEVCFPNYIVLQSGHVTQAVTEFGTILRRLIQKALQ